MRSAFIYMLAATLPALSVVAQRHQGGGGGGRFGGGGGFPNTFITVASAAPAATGNAAPAPAPAATDSPSAGAASGGSSGSVDASLIPPFGITAGIKANDGTQNCVGDLGKGIP